MLTTLPKTQAQNFVNPDLDGIITGFSSLPTGWQNVPDTDVVCLATNNGWASPDLTDLTQPDSALGIIGNPYSGATFVSGMRGLTPSLEVFQEGIMQTVTGFTVGSSYKINFQQAVVRQLNCLDKSGLWLVYIDSTLIGATTPTNSNATVHSVSFIWESRDVYFTATDTSHTIKFLPFDDDPNVSYSLTDTLGSLRMGIDSINLAFCFSGNGLGKDTIICLGDSIILNVATPIATYLWQDNSADSIFDVTQAGTYWVQVTTNTCSIADTIVITNRALSAFSLANDTTLCEGDSMLLAATTTNSTYLWQDNSIDSVFQVNQSGSYFVEVTNICGPVSDTINVIIDTLTVNLGIDTILCLGDTYPLNAANNGATYLWQDNSTDSIYTITQAGLYSAVVTRGNCIKADTISIVYDAVPVINLGKDTILCEGEALTLIATNPNSTYLWQDGSVNPTFSPFLSDTFWVKVTNSCGESSDSISLLFIDCDTLAKDTVILEMPNVFTPNRDGKNDLFLPVKAEGIVSFQLLVYNRWGQQIFESKQLMQGWDGRTTAGTQVTNGSYFWVIDYIDIDGVEQKMKGYVSLLRD